MKKEIIKEAFRVIFSGVMNILLYLGGALIAEYVMNIPGTMTNALVLMAITGALNFIISRWTFVRVCGWIHRRF